jgi:REP-associated tyrosine transposase
MPRLPRREQHAEGLCYHVFSRGHNRQTVFQDDDDRRAFLACLGRVKQRFDFRLYHYCLMSNHYHLVLRTGDAPQLSRLMAGLLRAYVHHYHRRYSFVGHLWQGRFKSPAIQDGGYLLSAGRYVERNPLELPWDYAWSSCRRLVQGVEDALVDESPALAELIAEAKGRQEWWRGSLMGADANEEAVRKGEWAIGDKQFRSKLRQRNGRPSRGGPGRPLSMKAALISPEHMTK